MPHFELARTNIEPESNCHGKAVMNGLVELCLTLLEVTMHSTDQIVCAPPPVESIPAHSDGQSIERYRPIHDF